MATQFISHLQPDYFMPFAGQYTLGGRLASLNRFRGVPEVEDLPDIFPPYFERAAPVGRMVLLNSGESFDLGEQAASAPFSPPDPLARQRFVERELVGLPYTYDDVDEHHDPRDLSDDVAEAHVRMVRHQDRWQGSRSDWSMYFDTGSGGVYRVPFDGTPARRVDGERFREPYVRVGLSHSLFDMILNRKAHFNNAEIGSHLRFFRAPDTYDPLIFLLACYLQR